MAKYGAKYRAWVTKKDGWKGTIIVSSQTVADVKRELRRKGYKVHRVMLMWREKKYR